MMGLIKKLLQRNQTSNRPIQFNNQRSDIPQMTALYDKAQQT